MFCCKNHRSSYWRCSVKEGVLKNFANFTGKYLYWSLLINLQDWEPATLLKKTPTQEFSCETCEIFKNIYFEEHLRTAASKKQYVTEKAIHLFLSQKYEFIIITLTVCYCHVTYAFQSWPSDFTPASSKEIFDIQATIECGFTLRRIRDMTRTYS